MPALAGVSADGADAQIQRRLDGGDQAALAHAALASQHRRAFSQQLPQLVQAGVFDDAGFQRARSQHAVVRHRRLRKFHF